MLFIPFKIISPEMGKPFDCPVPVMLINPFEIPHKLLDLRAHVHFWKARQMANTR